MTRWLCRLGIHRWRYLVGCRRECRRCPLRQQATFHPQITWITRGGSG